MALRKGLRRRGPGTESDTMSGERNSSGRSRAARTVTKKDLVALLADRSGQTKVVVQDLLQMFLDEIVRELARDRRVEFREFGVFDVKLRKPRMGRNPRTGEEVSVPARRVVTFKVGSEMRDRIERPLGSDR